MFDFLNSTSFKIKLPDYQLKNLSTMDKISKSLKEDNTIAYDVYKENNLIGFIMLKKYEDGYFLWDYAIDYKYQNLGYGQTILIELISLLKNKYNAKWISTTYKYGNNIAKHIYEKLGFVQTSVVNENNVHEVNMRLSLY